MLRKIFHKTVGREKHTFQIEGENLYSVLMEERKLSFPDIKQCGLCKSDDLTLFAHNPNDEFEYVTIKCKSCKGFLNFGQQKKNKDIFYLTTKQNDKGETLRDNQGFPVFNWKEFGSKE